MKRAIRYITSYIYSDSGFLVGMGSILNISGNYFDYNYCSSPEEADRKALKSDWKMVGQDIYDVMDLEASKQLLAKNHKHV